MTMKSPRIPKHVYRDEDRHGNVRWYLRRRGFAKVRIAGEPGTQTFKAAYEAALAQDPALPNPVRPRMPKPARLLSKGAGFVYFLRAGDTVKIGFSQDPTSRLRGLSTALSNGFSTFVVMPGSRHEEKRLHRMFAAHGLSGEWFSARPEVIRAMAQAAAYGRVGDATEIELSGPPGGPPMKSGPLG